MKSAPGVAQIVTPLGQVVHLFQRGKCFGRRRLQDCDRQRKRKEVEVYVTWHCLLLAVYVESLHEGASLSKNRATACCLEIGEKK